MAPWRALKQINGDYTLFQKEIHYQEKRHHPTAAQKELFYDLAAGRELGPISENDTTRISTLVREDHVRWMTLQEEIPRPWNADEAEKIAFNKLGVDKFTKKEIEHPEFPLARPGYNGMEKRYVQGKLVNIFHPIIDGKRGDKYIDVKKVDPSYLRVRSNGTWTNTAWMKIPTSLNQHGWLCHLNGAYLLIKQENNTLKYAVVNAKYTVMFDNEQWGEIVNVTGGE